MKDMSEIEIPETLAKKIEDMIKDTSFNSISDYITYVLEELLEDMEEEEETFSEEEEEKIKERLRALGYLD
ncbi:MAG: CopG family transcriptional regulator [Thermoplasmata archaeon]|nr:CopG family transcriptional regulator [Thermoplasmata archaeon]